MSGNETSEERRNKGSNLSIQWSKDDQFMAVDKMKFCNTGSYQVIDMGFDFESNDPVKITFIYNGEVK